MAHSRLVAHLNAPRIGPTEHSVACFRRWLKVADSLRGCEDKPADCNDCRYNSQNSNWYQSAVVADYQGRESDKEEHAYKDVARNVVSDHCADYAASATMTQPTMGSYLSDEAIDQIASNASPKNATPSV